MENNNNPHTALLVMDVQGAIVKMINEETPFFDALKKAIKSARSSKMPVIYIVIGFRNGYPEMSPNNKSFNLLKSAGMDLVSEEATKIHQSIAPEEEDIVIVKKRTSAFTGSDLEVVLRSLGIKNIVLTGIATSGVVLSTLREAADKDYSITVLSDCCADRDDEVHRVLITKVFPRQAEVILAGDWCNNNILL
jgi:nicotinamidase-related amidase